MGVLYDASNVVVGLAVAYFADVDEPMPANTVKFADDWAGAWVNPGGTEDGYQLTANASTQQHNIEEQANPVLVTLTSRDFAIAAQLAEDTLDSLRLAFGGGTITTAGSGPAIKTFTLSDQVDEFAFGLDMLTVGGVTRRIYVPRAAGAGNVSVQFRRASQKRLWPIQFSALCKPSEIIVREIP